jgi:hypothetical protein
MLDSLSGTTCTLTRIADGAMGADGALLSETTTTSTVKCSPLYKMQDAGDNAFTARIFVGASAVVVADMITINSTLWTVTKANAISSGTVTQGYLLELHTRGRVAP